MANTHAIAVDLAKVYATQTPEQFEKPIRYLAFGDEIKVEEIAEKHLRVRTRIFTELPDGSVKFEMGSGFIVPKKRTKSGLRTWSGHSIRTTCCGSNSWTSSRGTAHSSSCPRSG